MKTLMSAIKECIESKWNAGYRKFIIFPFGETGLLVKNVLNNLYGIQETYILDNHLCQYNSQIRELAFLNDINCDNYCIIIACTNPDIYDKLKSDVLNYFKRENIAEFFHQPVGLGGVVTKIGKYSYGPLCRNHIYIESIGAFCSFAEGTEVVQNHEMNYLTTHPMIYAGAYLDDYNRYAEYKGYEWYVEGVVPKLELIKKRKRSVIGNDVWLGRNVVITNYANIGNGVIAGAGAVITKDVPDYAVVAGVPARLIRYRYHAEEIECLNKIAWWDWPDDKIKENFDDFYLPARDFIRKHLNEER